MKLIQKLSGYIEEEICDAEKYAEDALEYKESDPVLAEMFYKLSNEEMGHMAALHSQVVRIIDRYRQEKGEPPEAMKMLYDIFHKKHMSSAATVKGLQSLYRGDK